MKKNKLGRNVKIWAFLALALLLVIKVPKHSIVTAEQEDPYVSENISEGDQEGNPVSDVLDSVPEDTAEGEEDAKNEDAASSGGEDDGTDTDSGAGDETSGETGSGDADSNTEKSQTNIDQSATDESASEKTKTEITSDSLNKKDIVRTDTETGSENAEKEAAQNNALMTAALEDEEEQEESSTPLNVETYITDVTIAYKTVSASEWTTIKDGTTDIPADAQLKFSMTYADLPVASVKNSGRTISYTLPTLLKNPSVQSANIQTSDGTTIGTISASEDSKRILLTFTENFLMTEEGEETNTISGSFAFYAYPDQNQVKNNPLQQITVGTKRITLSFETDSDARLGQLDLTKSDATFGTDDGGAYLEYTLTVSTGDTPMPDVTVTDQFTTNASFIESYIGVTGTETQAASKTAGDTTVNAATKPYETGTNAGQGKIYLGNSITEEDPIPSAAGANLTAPGVLVWKVGDLEANETRTLTYRARLKAEYVGAKSRGTITNEAASFSKNYPHTSQTKEFTPVTKVTTKKSVGDFQPDENGDGGTLTYQVTLTADAKNTYILKNVKINDSLKNGGTQNKYLTCLSYVKKSFQLYSGTEIIDSAELPSDANPHTGKSNPDITETDSGNTIGRQFDYYIAEMAPGETRTLVYQVHVSGNIYAAGNTDIEIKNNAAAYSDDTVGWGNESFSSENTTKSLGKKVWDRKLQSEALAQETKVTIPEGASVFREEDSTWNSTASLDEITFTVPKDSFRYQVVVNEAADWDVTSAVFGDALTNNYLAYSGYLRLDYYENGLTKTPESDAAAVEELQKKTISSTVWAYIDGQTSFKLTPTDLQLTAKGAYVLTYYATPKNVENISQVSSGNSFTMSGNVIGPGGTTVQLSGVRVSTSTIIEGGKSLKAEKSGWYFDHTKAASGDWANGSLYWVIEVSGTEISEGTEFKDTPGNSPQHYIRGTSMVGIYQGTVPDGKSFTDYYGSIEDVKNDSNLTKLSGNEVNGGAVPAEADYFWSADRSAATIRFLKTRSLASDKCIYIILRTEPSGALNGRDARTYTNSLSMKDSSADSFVKINEATLRATGAGTNFKETAGVFNYDGNTWEKVSSSGALRQLVQKQITEPGTYIEWRIKINYAGDLEGKVHVEDILPEGLEPAYVRYFWISSEIFDDAPTMPAITALDSNVAWTKLTYTGWIDGNNKGNQERTAIAYYNSSTRMLAFDVANLQKGGSVADRRSLEVQVVTKVTDSELLLNGGSKTYQNGITVTNEAGKIISTSSASADITKKTITKTMGSVNGGKLTFTLTVNPLGEDLAVNSDTLTLVDEMEDPLSFDTDSLTVTDRTNATVTVGSQIEATATGQKLTLTVPDGKSLTITYQAVINSAPNQQITVNNKANWYGYSQDMSKIENEKVSYTVEATAETSSTPVLEVKKSDQENTAKALSGAVFSLEEVSWDEDNNEWKKVENGISLTGTTGDNGTVSFGKGTSASAGKKLAYNTVYRLTETTAPSGYVLNAEPAYYVVAKADTVSKAYPEILKTWQEHGAKIYYSGTTYKVEVYNKKGTLALTKNFQNINSEALTGTQIPDGTYRFGIYEENSSEKLQELTLTYTGGNLTCQRDGVTVEKAEFTGLSVGTKYQVRELDKKGNPIQTSGSLATLANGQTFRVTYDKGLVEIPATGDGGTVTITNRQDVDTNPETGIRTDSNLLYTGILAGIAVLTGGVFIFRRRRR